MKHESLLNQLKEIGFDDASLIETHQLKLLPEVRNMCADNRCGAYGKKWSCPPYCGTLEECNQRMEHYQNGVVMLTVTKLEDSFDFEGMEEGNKHHNQLFGDAIQLLRAEKENILPFGAGGCRICETCTCPESSCRYPEKMIVSMEAYGLLVSDVCEKCGLSYFNGESTVTYVSCILF